MKHLLLMALVLAGISVNSQVVTLIPQAQDANGKGVEVPVSSTAATTHAALPANGTWSSGWLRRKAFIAAQIAVYSNVAGSYTIQYSDDSALSRSMPNTVVAYAPSLTRPGAFPINAEWINFTYTNGPAAQDSFKFEIRFLTTSAQPSMEGAGALMGDGRLAQINKGPIETKETANGPYDKVFRKGNSLMVHVDTTLQVSLVGAVNTTPSGVQSVTFPSAQPVTISGVVTTTPSGTQTVSVSNFPSNQTVSVSNFPATQAVSIASTVPVSGTFFQATQPVSAASLPLPTGASTAALQGTANTSLASIDGKLTSGIALPTGAATAANQNTELTNLSTIVTNTTGLATATGQATGNTALTTIATNSATSAPATTGSFTQYTLSAGVAQTIAAATGRKSVVVTSVAGVVLIGVGFTATANNYSYRIITNGTAEILTINAPLSISIISATAATVNVATSN